MNDVFFDVAVVHPKSLKIAFVTQSRETAAYYTNHDFLNKQLYKYTLGL